MKLVDMRGLKLRPFRVLVRVQVRVLIYNYSTHKTVALCLFVALVAVDVSWLSGHVHSLSVIAFRADLIFYPSYWVLHVLLFHMMLWICASLLAATFKQ